MYEAEKLIAAGRVSFFNYKHRVFFVRKVYKVNNLFKVEIIYYPVRNLILGYLPIIDLEKKKSALWHSEYGTVYVVQSQCSNN